MVQPSKVYGGNGVDYIHIYIHHVVSTKLLEVIILSKMKISIA